MDHKVASSIESIMIALSHHQVIAYPTEAVFGLGCDPDSEKAVQALLDLKNRSWEKGLILIADEYSRFESYVDDLRLSNEQKMALLSSWPGSVTWVIPAKSTTPKWLTGRFDSLAVRVTNHPLVRELCQKYGKPLVSTSANLSGMAPCRTAQEVIDQFDGRIPILLGNVGGRINPSEIRDALTGKLYREG